MRQFSVEKKIEKKQEKIFRLDELITQKKMKNNKELK